MRGRKRQESRTEGRSSSNLRILKRGSAMRVIFFYPGEEGTYVDNAHVTLYDNGIVHIKSPNEESTTHLQNCEVIWKFGAEAEDRAPKVRLLKPKSTSPSEEGERESNREPENLESEKKPGSTSPDLG